jgi:hypothetical protein
MYFLTFFCQKSSRGVALPTPPFPFGFTANTDHQRVGELRPDSAVVPNLARRHLSVFGPGLWRVQGVTGLQLGLISRSF